MSTPDKKNQLGTETPSGHGPDLLNDALDFVGKGSRPKTRKALAEGSETAPPADPVPVVPQTPEDKEAHMFELKMEAQYLERTDHMLELIHRCIFALGEGVRRPTLRQAMKTFTPDMLKLARTFQEPTLLLVPETSFAAKVKALNATVAFVKERIRHKAEFSPTATGEGPTLSETEKRIGMWKDVHWDFGFVGFDHDPGSKEITGWKAVIVDGAKKMEIKKGDDLGLTLKDRIRNRKDARKPGERGMSRHIYAMLMIEALRKGEPIDDEGMLHWTLFDDDHDYPASRAQHALWGQLWDPGSRQVHFGYDYSTSPNGGAWFRSSVGGEVKF